MGKSTTKASATPESTQAQGAGPAAQNASAGAGNQARQSSMQLATGTGTGSAASAFSAAASGGAKRELPFRAELEDFFGTDLGDIEAVFGGGEGLNQMGAAAAASPTDTVVFAEQNPGKELVAHEVAHVLQYRGAGGGAGTGTTAPGENSEQQAEEVGRRFAAGGGEAGKLDAAPSGVAREETGTPLERLREAANGNWVGDVDEGACLSLINQLTPDDKTTVRGDNALMRKLASAFDEDEMVQCVNSLGFELKWKAYWIEISGETSSVSAANWQVMLTTAPRQQLLEYFGYAEVFRRGYPYFGLTPMVLLAADRAGTGFTNIMVTYPTALEWFVQSTPATSVIEELASATAAPADIARIIDALRSAGKWDQVRGALPTGSGLPQTTRAALKRIVDNITSVPDAKVLFKLRFNHEIRAETTAAAPTDATTGASRAGDWSIENIRAVWAQLDVLPDQDITENTVLQAFTAITGGGGFWSNPNVQIGQANDPEYIKHTVRHEIGHSLHDGSLGSSINSWLRSEMEMWYLPSGDTGSQQAINALGGFPATYKEAASNTDKPFTEAHKTAVTQMLTSYIGSGQGSWSPSRTNFLDGQSDLNKDLWNSMPAGVQGLVTQSPSSWYNNHANFVQSGGKRYFLNYWYHNIYYLGKGYPVVTACRNYTSMSEKEFFADAYAEYFKDPAGYTDHSKWGGGLPENAKGFFKNNVLDRQPYTPPATGTGAPASAGASPVADGNAANTAAPQTGAAAGS